MQIFNRRFREAFTRLLKCGCLTKHVYSIDSQRRTGLSLGYSSTATAHHTVNKSYSPKSAKLLKSRNCFGPANFHGCQSEQMPKKKSLPSPKVAEKLLQKQLSTSSLLTKSTIVDMHSRSNTLVIHNNNNYVKSLLEQSAEQRQRVLSLLAPISNHQYGTRKPSAIDEEVDQSTNSDNESLPIKEETKPETKQEKRQSSADYYYILLESKETFLWVICLLGWSYLLRRTGANQLFCNFVVYRG